MNAAAATPDPRAFDAGDRARIDAALAAIARDLTHDDPVGDAIRYALAAGGKRLRPILCLAAMDAVGARGPREAQVRAACALELVHTYSLVHDDLPCMDDDDLRRGRPTTHRVHGTRAAMVAGVALIPLACRVLADAAADMGAPADRALEAVRELCGGAGAGGMVGGQILDLEGEGAAVDTAALRRIPAMKTAALFRAALRVGAVLGGASVATVDALGDYGEHLGMAFQITDDVLDVTMDSGALGKTAGKDADANKATFAARLGVSDARRAAAAEVDAALARLAATGADSPVLERLARFAADRDR
ncbi:MAG TPA: farnesyl diphosphate synthase [Longimicrobiales bacterium]